MPLQIWTLSAIYNCMYFAYIGSESDEYSSITLDICSKAKTTL